MQKFYFLASLLCFHLPAVFAQNTSIVPPPPAQNAPFFPVHDYAGLFTDEEFRDLNTQLQAYEKNTSNEFVIVVLGSIHNHVLEQVSLEIARSWQIGKYNRNNGVLLFITKKERQARLEIGRGLKDKVTDEQARQILQVFLNPNFTEEKYARGVRGVFEAVRKLVGDTYTTQAINNPFYRWQAALLVSITLILALIVQELLIIWLSGLAITVFATEYAYYANRWDIDLNYAMIYWFVCGFMLIFLLALLFGGGNRRGGGDSSYYDDDYYYSSGSSSGGSSGGSFDGDGASSDW